MILKTTPQTLETSEILDELLSVNNLLKYKLNVITKGFLISDNLISEIENFIRSNKISTKNGETQHICPRCLKAFAINRARECGFSSNIINYFFKIFRDQAIKKASEAGVNDDNMKELIEILDCEAGHNGYYLNEGELLEV